MNKMAQIFAEMGAFSEETDETKINTKIINKFIDEVLESDGVTKEQFFALGRYGRFWTDRIKAYKKAAELAKENDLDFRLKVLTAINSIPHAGSDAVEAMKEVFDKSPILRNPGGLWDAMKIVDFCSQVYQTRMLSDWWKEILLPAMERALEVSKQPKKGTASFPSVSPSAQQARENEIADLNKLYEES